MFKNLFKPKPTDFAAPFKGRLMTLEEVPDPVFSSKSMGDGFALELLEGKVLSPVAGKIVAVFPTGHAIGIKADDRNEYLIHLGLDTVNFKGEGFMAHVVLDQRVNPGDPLVDVDLEFFKNHKVSMICPILVVNANSRKIRLLKEGVVQSQEKDFLAITA